MKNLTILLTAGLAISASSLLAQDAVDRNTPPAVVPRQPPSKVPRGVVNPPLRTHRDPSGDKPFLPDQPELKINAIVIVKSDKEIVADGVPDASGVVVKDIPFLETADFKKMLQTRHIGQLLTENAIRDLEDDIILYSRDHGKLLVDVILPEQTIPSNGAIQLWFLEGKVGNVTISNEGRKWFRDSLFTRNLHLPSGTPLDSETLKSDLDWLNNNPFRQVDAAFKPGEKLGTTDVDIRVDDRIPIRPYVGYENSGTTNTGTDRIIAGLNWGNAFGLDHQANYQYSTDIEGKHVWAHSGSYIAPLPWRHTLMFYGSYVDAKADAGESFGGTSANGHSWQTSIRYSLPLPQIYQYRHELGLGFDFKRANNDLLAGGTNVLQHTDVDIAQFAVSYSGLVPDPYGKTSLSGELYYSPGGMTEFNHDSDFNELRRDTDSTYAYARINAERLTRLPCNFSWALRGLVQWASGRLQPSEQLALGGYNTIRGYNERVNLGDQGYIINNELRTPPFRTGLFHMDDQLQFLAFFDIGEAQILDPDPNGGDGNVHHLTLYSIGAGARYTVSRNFSLRLDYGIPLTHKNINDTGDWAVTSTHHHAFGVLSLGALLSF